MASSLPLYALFVTLLAAAFVPGLAATFRRLASAPLASGIVTTLAWLLSSTAEAQSVSLFALGAIVAGGAAACLVLSWGNELTRASSSRTFVAEVVIAHGIVPLAHVAFLMAPAEASYQISAFYPFASGACAYALQAMRSESRAPACVAEDGEAADDDPVSRANAPTGSVDERIATQETGKGRRRIDTAFARFAIACALTSFVLALIYNLYRVPEAEILHLDPTLDTATFVLRAAILFALAVFYVKWKTPKQRSLYKAIFVLGVVGFLLFPLLGFSNVAPYSIIGLAFSLLGVFIWTSTALLCRLRAIPSHRGFGVAIALFEGLLGLPILIASIYAMSNINSPTVSNLIVLVGIGALALSYLFVMPAHVGDPESPATSDSGDGQESAARRRREKAIAAFADSHGLTARERDVFERLAESKSRARICEELHISDGTLNTHISHIYQKCDVHSKDDLIDAVEQTMQSTGSE